MTDSQDHINETTLKLLTVMADRLEELERRVDAIGEDRPSYYHEVDGLH